MRRMLTTPPAELFQLNPVRRRLAVLGCRIVPLFAITALHRNDLSGHKTKLLAQINTCQITSSRDLYFFLRSFQKKSYIEDHGATPITKTRRTPRIQNASRIHALFDSSICPALPTTPSVRLATYDVRRISL